MFWNKNKYKILNKLIFDLPGIITKYALNSNNFLFAIIRSKENEKYYEQFLYGISLKNGIVWKYDIQLSYPNELRVDNSGYAWIAHKNEIIKIDENGIVKHTINLVLNKKQQIGSFIILKEGFIVSIQANEQSKPDTKVVRINNSGEIIWDTPIMTNNISHSGVVEMKASNNWKIEKQKPWLPKNWLCLYDNAILLSSKNILVSFFEMPRSGIGKSYCLDLDTGIIKWTTKPAPYETIACYENGSFIIGHQGYGAFDTLLYNSNGDIINQWKSVGRYVVDNNKNIFLVEMNNSSNSKLHISQLLNDGKILKGEQIEGYYIADPVIDEYCNIAFWRNESLQIVDKNLKRHILLTIKTEKKYSMTERMLLINSGLLVFGLDDKLYQVQTNLGKLDNSSWSCKYGNLERNPVINEYVIEK